MNKGEDGQSSSRASQGGFFFLDYLWDLAMDSNFIKRMTIEEGDVLVIDTSSRASSLASATKISSIGTFPIRELLRSVTTGRA